MHQSIALKTYLAKLYIKKSCPVFCPVKYLVVIKTVVHLLTLLQKITGLQWESQTED